MGESVDKDRGAANTDHCRHFEPRSFVGWLLVVRLAQATNPLRRLLAMGRRRRIRLLSISLTSRQTITTGSVSRNRPHVYMAIFEYGRSAVPRAGTSPHSGPLLVRWHASLPMIKVKETLKRSVRCCGQVTARPP